MRFRVIADFEQRIEHQLFGARLVRCHPLAASKERRLDALFTQIVDHATIVAGNLTALLAEIESQSDHLFTGRNVNTADRAAKAVLNSKRRRDTLNLCRSVVDMDALVSHFLAWHAGEGLRREAGM